MASAPYQALRIGQESTPGRAASPPPRFPLGGVDAMRAWVAEQYNVPPASVVVHSAIRDGAAAPETPPADAHPWLHPPPAVRDARFTYRAGAAPACELELIVTDADRMNDRTAGSPAWVEALVTDYAGPGWRVTGTEHMRTWNEIRIRVSARYAPPVEAVRQIETPPEYTPGDQRDQAVVIAVSEEMLRTGGPHAVQEYLIAQARAVFGPDYTPVEIAELPDDYRAFSRCYRVRGRYTGPAPAQEIRGDVLFDPTHAAEFSIFGGRGYGRSAYDAERDRMMRDELGIDQATLDRDRADAIQFAYQQTRRALFDAADPAALAAAEQARAERQARQAEERAAREAANARARVLLESLLTPEQRADFAETNTFTVAGNLGRRYRIEVGTSGNVWELDSQGRPVVQWCAAPEARSGVPIFDSMAAQLLHLRHDEAGFRAVANRLRTQTYLPDGTPVATEGYFPW